MKVLVDVKCPNCGEVEERFVNNEVLLRGDLECNHCHYVGVDRIFNTTAVSFRLYGEGFHNRTHRDTGDWA